MAHLLNTHHGRLVISPATINSLLHEMDVFVNLMGEGGETG